MFMRMGQNIYGSHDTNVPTLICNFKISLIKGKNKNLTRYLDSPFISRGLWRVQIYEESVINLL